MQFTEATWNEYRGQVSQLTGHRPASKFNIRDSVFGAALKLRDQSGVLAKTGGRQPQVSDWDENNIRKAAGKYYGRCAYPIKGKMVYYCDDIVRRWKALGGG